MERARARFTKKQVSGDAKVDCEVTLIGSLDDCRVVEENPPNTGYGAESIWLVRNDRFVPARDEHGPFAWRVTIQTVFTVAGSPFPTGASRKAPKLVTRPTWSSAPTFAHVALAFAGGVKTPMLLRVHCRVDTDGSLICPHDQIDKNHPDVSVAVDELLGLFRLDRSGLSVDAETPLVVDLAIQTPDVSSDSFKAHTLSQPIWVAGLDPEGARALFPAEAKANSLTSGLGRAECTVAADGTLTTCQSGAADPSGFGFSEAAVKMARGMRMSRWTAAGGPVDGAHIVLPLRFDLKPGASTE